MAETARTLGICLFCPMPDDAARTPVPHESRLGLLTRPAALATSIVLCMTTWSHWTVQAEGFPGAEKSLIWLAVTLYFVVHGGGRLSVDRAIGRQL